MANSVRGCLIATSAVLALVGGMATEARAGVVYAYSVEQTSGYTFSGATVGTITPLSSSSGAQMGSPSGGEAHTGTLDVLQSYVGPDPRPAENTFTPVGMVNPDYVRGDALLTVTPTFTTNNVAEGFLNGPGNSAGAGSWAVSAPITVTTAGALTLSFNFTNQLTLVNTPSGGITGTVAADYNYTFEVEDAAHNIIFVSSPNAVNQSASLTSAGSISNPGSGTESITTGTLAVGTYTATISGSEHVFLTNGVPEPGPLTLAAVGAGALALAALRRRLSSARR